MFRKSGNSQGPGAPSKVPSTGAVSSLGPKPAKLRAPKQPRAPNTRDYGKKLPSPVPQPSPYGPMEGF